MQPYLKAAQTQYKKLLNNRNKTIYLKQVEKFHLYFHRVIFIVKDISKIKPSVHL